MSEAQSAKRNHRTKSMLASYVRYSHLPGIFPRLRELAAKFGHFAYLLATIYGAVGLIPRAHPVLNPINIGKFGFRDVFGAASRNLVLSWKNIDQIAVFAAVILALITLVIQLGIIAFIAFTNTAYAAPLDFFATPNPEEDVVLIFLEQMFGDLNIFSDDGHSAPGMANTASHPVFQGLYEMLGFYSRVMMVFAVLIVLYFVLTVLA